ncbi:MAG: fibrobacter succinogenes major paralogous domain-containing protein [Bacteroidales bacterium]|jgi:hypothetical protein|nr:fibrobacter succinogenes major paralogous domain-containing protein [Bacteroidales bacterium]
MKKIKTGILFVIFIIIIFSCNKESGGNLQELNNGQGKYTLPEITATNDGIVARTSLDGTAVLWRTGDRIAIVNTNTNIIYQYVLNSGAGTGVGEFTAVGTAASYDNLSDLVAVYPAISASVSGGTISVALNKEYDESTRNAYGITAWNSDSTHMFCNNDVKVSYQISGTPETSVNFKFKELGVWSSFVMDFSGIASDGEYALSMIVTTTGGTKAISGTAAVSGAGTSSPSLGTGDSTSVSWTFAEPVSLSAAFTKSLMLLPSVTVGNMLKITLTSTMRTYTFYANPKTFAGGEILRFPITAGSNFTEGTAGTNKKYTVRTRIANSYMVAPGGSVDVPVTIRGNGGADAGTVPGLIPSKSINPASVGIVWETAINLISVGSINYGEVTVTAGGSAGNAVIAAYSGADQTGDILWSWHIWVVDYDPDNGGATYTVTNSASASYVFMDRNLGATTSIPGLVTSDGLYYQWGRKNPFTASSSVNANSEVTIYDKNGNGFILKDREQTVSAHNNLLNAIGNPHVFYVGVDGTNINYDWYTAMDDINYQNDALWGGSDISAPSAKTIFDPCPAGWRVPAWNGSKSPWDDFNTSNSSWANYGRTKNGAYYPAAGNRPCESGALQDVGATGYYWSASPYSFYVYTLEFRNDEVLFSDTCHRASGYSVRCVRE